MNIIKRFGEDFELAEGISAEEYAQALKDVEGIEQKIKFFDIEFDEDGLEKKEIMFIVPDRTAVANYQRFSDTNPSKASKDIFNACVKSHKQIVLDSKFDYAFNACLNAISQIIPISKAILKKR
jgi:hypothetical protein